eukprot:3062892-Rhodomonas_salina.3
MESVHAPGGFPLREQHVHISYCQYHAAQPRPPPRRRSASLLELVKILQVQFVDRFALAVACLCGRPLCCLTLLCNAISVPQRGLIVLTVGWHGDLNRNSRVLRLLAFPVKLFRNPAASSRQTSRSNQGE